VLFPCADAVIVHTPIPVVPPLAVHGPDAVKLTGRPAEEDALNENVLPYCTLCKGAKLIVCDIVLEPCGRIVNAPDTELAELKALVPCCDAVTVQLPVPMSTTLAEETPFAIDWLPMEQGPVVLKLTCNPFAAPFDMAVAVIGCGPGRATELGNEPRAIVWSFLSTAGGDGRLWRCVGSTVTGSSVVDIV
jgi:hypothetical protein